MPGFGHEYFGVSSFGHSDWPYIVLWEELPEDKKKEDLEAGGYYHKFVQCLLPPFEELLRLIYGSHKHLIDPRTARKDLLRYIAGNFGIIPDLSEPEEFQRTKIEIAGRWRLIKGTKDSYKVLCAIHGFNVNIEDVWWNGFTYSSTLPNLYDEVIAVVP